ncbi:MAG: hypothetical protein AAGC65_24710 [Mucilaginibacter sp.]|uniref:hypothetical protein n=1 Tax=Mucilaginibacter sp. TaxID=1882438 RepID=UPI0031AC9A92
MINPKPSAIRLLAFLLITFAIQSCEPRQPGSWKNDQISSSDREKFHKLNDELFSRLKINDEKDLEQIMSRDLINYPYKNRSVELVSNRVKATDYTLLEEYYVVNKYIDVDTVKTTSTNLNSYSIIYQGLTHQMYLAFFVPKNKTIANQEMITAVYSKYDYGWKLSDLKVRSYTVNGKTAPQLYQQAKESYRKGYLMDAFNTASSAILCSHPSTLWRYAKEPEFTYFYNTVMKEAANHYKFPIVIDQVPTHPRIFNIFNQTTPEGDFPMIYYLSSIKLTDTTAVKQENERIKKVITQTFPGIDQNKKYVLYSAFNERPDGKKTVDHIDMESKLK